jgi:CHASE2 domain-containing sensor protein
MKELPSNLKSLLNRSPRLRQFGDWLVKSQKNLSAKGRWYWILAGFLLTAGMIVGHLLGTQGFWVAARYYVYNVLQKSAAHPLHASTRTVVVLIGDDEFWNGELARRIPLKRDYLACLLLKLDEANPAAIALDIDLSAKHPDYQKETDRLTEAVKFVAHNRPVIVSQQISRTGHSWAVTSDPNSQPGSYESVPSILDSYHFDNVSAGFVLLRDDVRQIPLVLSLKDGTQVESFAAAIVKPLDATALQDAQASGDSGLPYGTFIPPDRIKQMSANYVFATDARELKKALAANVVLVGGAWHSNAFEESRIDSHPTPVGEIPGVFIHANYVEALLTHRVSRPISKILGIVIEFLLAAFIAVIFAWKMKPVSKFKWAGGLSLILVLTTYVFWQNLGLFFDFFIPLILLGSHAAIAQIIEWRDEAYAANRA